MPVLTFETVFGTAALAYTALGLRGVSLPGGPLPAAAADSHPDLWRRAARRLAGALRGNAADFRRLPLDWTSVPAFHRDVYLALQAVPAGVTLSYGELAARAGRPGAARAVGQAMARNRWPIVVPCHRVLASDGSLGGWSGAGGLPFKRQLLDLEAGQNGGTSAGDLRG